MGRLYGLNKKIIAITGGIATGKSSFSNLLRMKGYEVICADDLIKKVYQKSSSLDFIKAISNDLVSKEQINFKKLRKVFFDNADIKTKVENYLYPELEKEFLIESKQIPSPIIYDIPLLFEKNLQSSVDASILIYATKEQQISRLCKRDKIPTKFAEEILNHQIPIDKKKELADLIIDNSKDENNLNNELKKKFLPLFESLKH